MGRHGSFCEGMAVMVVTKLGTVNAFSVAFFSPVLPFCHAIV